MCLLVKDNSGELKYVSEGPQSAPESGVANPVHNEVVNLRGDAVVPPAEGHDTAAPASQDLSPCLTSNAAGSPPAHQENASLVIDSSSESKKRSANPNQIRKTLNMTERRGGTRALVEKTREAFLLQMAIDTRKAG